ncbi:MAG TPA: hypothetical protein VMG12_40375 [Polyangiaceae bacterium]|nr:hypothetical protein [Polyangiaceae bacterium]
MTWRGGIASWCVGLVGLLGAAAAHADDVRLTTAKIGVSYRAPAVCPDVSTFMLLLARHLRGGDNAPLYARVEISEAGPPYRLALTVYTSALPLRSEETASSCDELVRLAAFMAAVARTQAVIEKTSTEPPEAEASVAEEVRPPPPPARVENSRRVPDVAPRATGPGWLVAGQLHGGLGLLPGVSFGTGPLVEVAWRNVALRSAASWWLPGEAAATGSFDSLAPLTLTLQSLDLAACLRQPVVAGAGHALALGVCGVFSGYRFGSESRQPGAPSAVAYRSGWGLDVGAMWGLPGALQVGAELGLSELAAPLRVHAEPYREALYESRGSQMRFSLLMGLVFGGDG